jgi:hypothetical protein
MLEEVNGITASFKEQGISWNESKEMNRGDEKKRLRNRCNNLRCEACLHILLSIEFY